MKICQIVQFENVLDAYSVSHLCGESFLNFNLYGIRMRAREREIKPQLIIVIWFFFSFGWRRWQQRVVCHFPKLYTYKMHRYMNMRNSLNFQNNFADICWASPKQHQHSPPTQKNRQNTACIHPSETKLKLWNLNSLSSISELVLNGCLAIT